MSRHNIELRDLLDSPPQRPPGVDPDYIVWVFLIAGLAMTFLV
ncbi:MAG: hypothetical protein OSB57_11445 [Planctomycetota bacterium]|nr:hypothetical protein [Planctomycetota bacterium]